MKLKHIYIITIMHKYMAENVQPFVLLHTEALGVAKIAALTWFERECKDLKLPHDGGFIEWERQGDWIGEDSLSYGYSFYINEISCVV